MYMYIYTYIMYTYIYIYITRIIHIYLPVPFANNHLKKENIEVRHPCWYDDDDIYLYKNNKPRGY
jgi:hypothetical protein